MLASSRHREGRSRVDFGTFLLLFGDLTQGQVLRSMRLFAREVMPAFR